MRAGSTRPQVEPFSVVPPSPSSTGDAMAEASSAAATNVDVPPLTTSDDSDIRRTLDHVVDTPFYNLHLTSHGG